MNGWPCPQPNFPWNEAAGWYEACTECGRLAWDHEQADPIQDISNDMRRIFGRTQFRPDPPTMRP